MRRIAQGVALSHLNQYFEFSSDVRLASPAMFPSFELGECSLDERALHERTIAALHLLHALHRHPEFARDLGDTQRERQAA